MVKKYDLSNQKFGSLFVIRKLDIRSRLGDIQWECLCDCGNLTKATTSNLRSGNRISCGCLFMVNKKHGMSKEPEYFAWDSMIQRCTNKKSLAYYNYGARGIKVCSKWLESFENFYEDMGKRPDDSFSLDRIDVNGDYYKENCRWSDKSTQGFNRRIAPNNTSGRTGVYWHKSAEKWTAGITVKGKSIHLGLHNSFEGAVKAREEAELEYFGVIKNETTMNQMGSL